MKTTDLVVFALLGLLAGGCASSSDNPNSSGTYATPTNSEDAAVMRDIKQGHDSSSSVDKPPVNGGAPGAASGPGASPQ